MEDIKNKVLKYAKAGYEVEIYIEKIKKLTIETAEESLENVSKSEEIGVGIRVLRDYKIGFAYTTDIKEGSLKDCLEQAYQACDILPPDEANAFHSGDVRGDLAYTFDYQGVNKSLDEKVQLVLNLEREAKALDSRIKGVRKATLKENIVEVYHFNTLGLDYHYNTSFYVSTVATLAQEGQDSAISYEYRASKTLNGLDFESMVKDVVFKATSQLNPQPFQTCQMPVVLYRESSAMLLEAFSSMFLGDSLIKNKTLLKDKVGEEIASSCLTVFDDATLPDGLMTAKVDAEGIETSRKVVIDKGVFKNFLHSLYTANKTRAHISGNSVRRSFKNLPNSGITNLYIQRGKASLEDLLSYYDQVFLVFDLMGLHTVDPISGEFSLGASGLVYSKGKLSKNVRGVVIGGNIIDLWKNIVEVGSDFCFYGNIGSPSLLIKSLTIGG